MIPRMIIVISVLISLVLSSYYLLREKKIIGFSPLKPLSGVADLKMKKLHLEEKQGNQKRWQLNADLAETYEDRGLTLMKDVEIIYFKGDQESFVINGKTGTLDNQTYSLTIKGDVKVAGPDGFELLSPSLTWDATKGIITTEDEIDLKKNWLNLKGRGLISTPDLAMVKINGSVRAQIKR